MAGDVSVPLHAFVDSGGLFLDGFHRLVDGGENLVFNIDEVEGRFRDLFRYGCNGCNRLADVADLLEGEYLLVAELFVASPDALLDPKRVLAGHDRPDAGKLLGLGRVDVYDLRVRVGAADGRSMPHAGHFNIPDIAGIGG